MQHSQHFCSILYTTEGHTIDWRSQKGKFCCVFLFVDGTNVENPIFFPTKRWWHAEKQTSQQEREIFLLNIFENLGGGSGQGDNYFTCNLFILFLGVVSSFLKKKMKNSARLCTNRWFKEKEEIKNQTNLTEMWSSKF